MSIYSANRMGSAASAAIIANEADAKSFGNILYESQVNDQAFFEAVVASDMNECRALQEGTLLESEIRALNEASVKEFFEGMKTRIRRFWKKIKDAIAAVINKILAYVLKDGKAFVKDFEAKYKGSASATAKVPLWYDESKFNKKITDVDEIEGKIRADKGNTDDSTKKAELIAGALGKTIGENSCTPKEFRNEKFIEKTCDKDKDISINELKKAVSEGAASIKGLKTLEKTFDARMAKLEKLLKKEERDAADAAGTNPGAVIKRISMLVSVYETVTSVYISAAIGATKSNIKNARKGLSDIYRTWKGEKKDEAKAQNEAAIEDAVAAEEFDAAMDPTTAPEVDAETKEAIDTVVAAADDEIKVEE